MYNGYTLANGKKVAIDKVEIENLAEFETTYNFEVADFHTYYVSESNVLVHNKCAVDINDTSNDAAVIGKMKDLNQYQLKPGEYKVADMLPDLGNPKAN